MRPRELKTALIEAFQSSNDCANNSYAMLNRNKFDRLISALYDKDEWDDKWLDNLGSELLELLSNKDVFLDHISTHDVFSKLGEMDCYWLCKTKGIEIKPNDDKKAEHGVGQADFVIECSDGPLYLEVKSPGPNTAKKTVDDHLEESLEIKAEQEDKIAAGANYVSSIQFVEVWPEECHRNSRKYIPHFFINKVNSLRKKGQMLPDTLMVINPLWIQFSIDPGEIMEKFSDVDPLYNEVNNSGMLWMSAFGKTSDHVYDSQRELIGRDCVFDKEGFLVDFNNEDLKGIIYLSEKVCEGELKAYSLIRKEVMTEWNNSNYSTKVPRKIEVFHTLCGDLWNDEDNSNSTELAKKL